LTSSVQYARLTAYNHLFATIVMAL
jgi:hypothetical protein